MKIVKTKLTENCHFCSREVLLYITWACFVMKYGAFILEKNLVSSVCFFRDTGFRMDSLFSILKIYRILLKFHSFQIY